MLPVLVRDCADNLREDYDVESEVNEGGDHGDESVDVALKCKADGSDYKVEVRAHCKNRAQPDFLTNQPTDAQISSLLWNPCLRYPITLITKTPVLIEVILDSYSRASSYGRSGHGGRADRRAFALFHHNHCQPHEKTYLISFHYK